MAMYVPDPVVKRLPMYCRYLSGLECENILYISSAELADLMGLTASQVRQDINIIGGAGRRGCGYLVTELKQHIDQLMGMNRPHRMIVIGAGNLGNALLGYTAFEKRGFSIVALFDKYPRPSAHSGDIPLMDVSQLETYLAQHPADIAILTLPASDAQKMARRLYDCGIRGFWNFAPTDLQLPRDAAWVNVHLDESLEMLSYHLENGD